MISSTEKVQVEKKRAPKTVPTFTGGFCKELEKEQ